MLGIGTRGAGIEKFVADEYSAQPKPVLLKLRRLLLVVAIAGAGSVGTFLVEPQFEPQPVDLNSVSEQSYGMRSQLVTEVLFPADLTSAWKQLDKFRSQLTESTEKLKNAHARIDQLEAQLKQVPSATNFDRKELEAQLAQATDQLKAARGQISQLESRLKQAPNPADFNAAPHEGEEVRAQLTQAADELTAQDRVRQLEAQLMQTPAPADLDKARQQADELRSQLSQAGEQLETSQDRVSELAAQLDLMIDGLLRIALGPPSLPQAVHMEQAPAPADLDKARQQADELRSQLSQAGEQLETSQGRIRQLENQLKIVLTTDLNAATRTPSATVVTNETVGGAGVGKGVAAVASSMTVDVAVEGNSPAPGVAGKADPENMRRTSASPVDLSARQLSISSADLLNLLNRGDVLLSTGDIASARLFYERGAEAGDGQAALRLAESYDRAFIERAQLHIRGDPVRAAFWYARARELGAKDAEILLKSVQPE